VKLNDNKKYDQVNSAEDYKTEIRNQSQIWSIWLAEMATSLRLVSILSFITLGPDLDGFFFVLLQ
jgi:hypothetical protein